MVRASLCERTFRAGYALLIMAIVAINAAAFAWSEAVRRLGPPPIDRAIAYSPVVVDRDGKLLRPFITKDGYWRLPASTADVDKRFLAMLIAYEDKRFLSHKGVDPYALLRAAWQAAWHRKVVSGGSTLTMQVARLLEPRPNRTLEAKLIEMVRAIQIEQRLSKEEILSLYLGLAPYGGNLEGARAASLAYFGKEPKHLSISEAALLVALPQSPEARRPDRFAGAARQGRDHVLKRAGQAGIISNEQALLACAEETSAGRKPFPMLAAHVSERLVKLHPESQVERTTIQRGLQQRLEALARNHAERIGGGVSVALLAVDNATGEVRAHVSGPDYFDRKRAGQVDLTIAPRSPGSALKPFIYGLAFEDGLVHPQTLIDDRPSRFGAYAPENFNEDFAGTVTVRKALQQSLNVPAVQLLSAVGPNRLIARMRAAGAAPSLPADATPGLAVGLGGASIRLTELTSLYVALARGGIFVPLSWQKPEEVLAERRLFDASAAWHIADILIGATPPANAPAGRIAFKTGTSYGYRDAWSLGFDGATTIGVWVGRPDNAPVPGLVGRDSAAPILFEAFQRLGERRAPLAPAPPGVVLAKTNELPASLQRFRPHRLPETAAGGTADAPLVIAYPLDGSQVDLDLTDPEEAVLPLKVLGGTPPYTWLVDGRPVIAGEIRRESLWEHPAQGFARLSVIDARGASASATIRLD